MGRIIATPVLLMIAGYLVAGLVGLGIAAAIGVAYVVWASSKR